MLKKIKEKIRMPLPEHERQASQDLKCLSSNLAYHFSAYTGQLLALPHWIYISLTHRCNNICKMCGVRNILQEEQLEKHILQNVLKEISAFKTGQVVVFTGGEPFLREDTFSIMEYALSLDIETELVSNGSRIDDRRAQKIMESGLSNMAISLDGAKAETHDYIRGRKGSFAEAIAAIQLLLKWKKRLKHGPQVSVWTTIMNYNLEELPDIALLTQKMGVECLVYHPVIVTQEDMQKTRKQGELWIPEEKMLLLEKQIAKIVDYKNKEGRIAFLHDPYLFINYFRGNITRKDWKCNPFQFLNIGPDGNVSSCGRAFGNIKKMSLKNCLKTKEADKAREKMSICPKPCLQTCWARPEADNLDKIVDAYLQKLSFNRGAELHSELWQAEKLLTRYEQRLKLDA